MKRVKTKRFWFFCQKELFSQDMGTDIQLAGWGPEVKSRLLKGNNEKFQLTKISLGKKKFKTEDDVRKIFQNWKCEIENERKRLVEFWEICIKPTYSPAPHQFKGTPINTSAHMGQSYLELDLERIGARQSEELGLVAVGAVVRGDQRS